MFEGKNIHFSDVDHKALCSCSEKVCKQRRLNGYAFCLRHILEDPSAPFKQCLHQNKHKQCSNPIPLSTPSEFCTCHSNGARKPEKKTVTKVNGFTSVKDNDPYAFSDADPPVINLCSVSHSPSQLSPNRQLNTSSIAKLYPELAEKLERVKTKTSEPRSNVKSSHSRTMNRLQNKIALNKIKDKLKNRSTSHPTMSPPLLPSAPLTPTTLYQGSSSPSPASVAEVKLNNEAKDASITLLSSTPSPVMSARPSTSKLPLVNTAETEATEIKPQTSCVKLKRPSRVWSESEAKRKLKRRSAVRTYAFYASEKVHSADLLPMGIDSSDESDVDDLLPCQHNWLLSSSDEESPDEDMDEELSSNIRKTKLALHKAKLRRQYTQLRRMHNGNAAKRSHIFGDLRALLMSARSSTVCCVRAITATTSSSAETEDECTRLTREVTSKCLYRGSLNEAACQQDALPFTNHCSRHVMYNVDQQIYKYCTAKFADNTQCCTPVCDPRHELALCPEHAAKADNYERNHEPRPKKPRKKTKPSALTRPPKKGKKKKNQRKKSDFPEDDDSPLRLIMNDDIQIQPTSVLSQQSQPFSIGVTTHAPPNYANQPPSSSTQLPNDIEFLPGMEKELDLPIDTEQATQFLDEHDLHDVLNKLPDEAFDLLAGCADDKAFEDGAQVTLDSAWAEMSQDLNSDPITTDPAVSNEDDITKQIAVSLLNQPLSPTGSIADDLGHDSINELASSLSANDLKNISQVLSGSLFAENEPFIAKTPELPPPRLAHPMIFPQNGVHAAYPISSNSGLIQPSSIFTQGSSHPPHQPLK